MIPFPITNMLRYRDWFRTRTGLDGGTYEITPRSPWPSEILALTAFGYEFGVKTWLESGTYHGQAMATVARVMPETMITTVEVVPAIADVAIERIARAKLDDRVAVRVGDGDVLLPVYADSLPHPIGVFLDGPKSLDAVRLALRLLATRPAVAFVAMHDMPRSVHGRASPARAAIDALGTFDPWCASWATDDHDYVIWSRALDDGLHAAHVTEDARSGWRPYEHFAAGQPTFRMLSYGPTIAFLYRESI